MVHEAAFADQSPGLERLMRGEMSEGQAGEAKWEDVDKATFIRFAQFVYIGDYSTPKMIVKSSDPPREIDAEPPSPQDGPGQWGDAWNFGASPRKGGKKLISRSPTPVFKALSYPLPKPRFNFVDTCDPTVGDGPSENIGEILLIHASLYVLAEKWRIDRLKRLTLFKIHKTLSMFSLDTPKLEQIIHFVRYAYSDQTTPDLDTKIDGLRELICQYIAAHAEFTSKDTTFTALIEEGGPLARDLWKLVAPRINSS
jgi:hypothetical protein